jgi:phage regulator Rha-like protein
MNKIVKFETLENKLIRKDNQLVLLDKDVASLYDIEPKKLRQQIKRNIEKFPRDYAYQLSEDELDTMVSQNVTPSKQIFGGSLPYVFTEKGLYMVATILRSKKATEATFIIIETFSKLKKLSRNLNSISSEQTKEEQEQLVKESNILLEEVIDIEPVREIKDDNITEIETKIELNLGFAKVSRIIKKKVNEQNK